MQGYIVFQEKNFVPTAVTKWNFLPTGISFLPDTGLLTTPPTPVIPILCPGTIGVTPALPYLKFDSNGMVAAPTVATGLFVNFFSGFVDQGGTPNYTDKKQETAQRFDQIKVAPFTGVRSMLTLIRRVRARGGNSFSLVEVVLALGVISFALVAILGVFPIGLAANRTSISDTRAAQLVNAVVATIDAQCATFDNVQLFWSATTRSCCVNNY